MENAITGPAATQTINEKSRRRRRGGRPALLPSERRSFRLNPGFTAAEFKRLEERADRAGLDEIEFIRACSLNLPIKTIPAANRQAVAALVKIGSNINQIAHHLNAEGKFGDSLRQKLESQLQQLSRATRLLLDPPSWRQDE